MAVCLGLPVADDWNRLRLLFANGWLPPSEQGSTQLRTALDLHPVGMSIMPKRLHIRSKRQLHCQLPYESLWSTMLRLLQAAVLLWHLVFLSCSGVLRLSSVKKYNDNHCTRNAHIYKCICIRVFVSE